MRSRRLRPAEIAEAAVLADVTVVLCLLGWLLPFPGVFLAAAVTPMAVVAVRNRPRAVLTGAIAGLTVAFLIAGAGLAIGARRAQLPSTRDREKRHRRRLRRDEAQRAAPRIDERRFFEPPVAHQAPQHRVGVFERGLVGVECLFELETPHLGQHAEQL